MLAPYFIAASIVLVLVFIILLAIPEWLFLVFTAIAAVGCGAAAFYASRVDMVSGKLGMLDNVGAQFQRYAPQAQQFAQQAQQFAQQAPQQAQQFAQQAQQFAQQAPQQAQQFAQSIPLPSAPPIQQFADSRPVPLPSIQSVSS